MASLIKRKNGFYAQWYDTTRTPNRKRFSLKTSERGIARRRIAKLERDTERGLFDPWVDDPFTYDRIVTESPTISTAVHRFLEEKRKADLSENTVALYRYDLGTLSGMIGREKLIERITAAQIEPFVHDPSIAKSTRHKRYRIASIFLNWCKNEKYLAKNPIADVAKPRKPDKLPKVVKPEELERICSRLHEDYERKVDTYNGVKEGDLIWMIPLFRFALYSGMRVSELARLRWKHIDSDNRLIYIHIQKNRKAQTIPLNKRLAEILQTLSNGGPMDYVFKSPRLSTRERSTRAFALRVNSTFVKYRKAAGIDKPLTIHSTRHGFCTMLAEANRSAVVIKEAARHADIQTSMRYVHLSNEHLKRELDDVFG